MIQVPYDINLKPHRWSQEIRYYSGKESIGVDEGGSLNATCAPTADCKLRLSSGSHLRDYTISLGVYERQVPIPDDERKGGKLSRDAIGGLWYVSDQGFVLGWLYFERRNFFVLWDQIRTGGYADCTIGLGVEGGDLYREDVWSDDNPLSIVNVSVRFDRSPNIAPKKSWWK